MLDQNHPPQIFVKGQLSQTSLKDFEKLRLAQAALRARLESLGQMTVPLDVADLEALAQKHDELLEHIAEQAQHALSELNGVSVQKAKGCAQSKWAYARTRDAVFPNTLKTVTITWGVVWVEAAAMAAVLTADGKMSPQDALMYGLIFAMVNAGIGQLGGYFGLRNMLLRKRYELEEDDPRPAKTRRFGRWFFGASAGMLGALIFAAARIRATGSHEDVFTFTDVSLAATFNDGIALVVIGIGLAASVINFFKGYNGYSDPLPGYDAAWKEADAVDALAEQTADQGIGDIKDEAMRVEDIILETRDEIEDLIDEIEAEARAFLADEKAHDARVDAAKQRELKRTISVETARQMVDGDQASAESMVRAVFDGLKLNAGEELAAFERVRRGKGLLTRVDALLSGAESAALRHMAEIESALAQYATAKPTFDRTLNH